LRGIVGEDSDLRPLLFKEHDAAAILGGEDDSLANRPLIITAFPLGIQYLPVIHSKHVVSRGITDNRAPIPFLLGVGLKGRETEGNQQQRNRDQEALQSQNPVGSNDRLTRNGRLLDPCAFSVGGLPFPEFAFPLENRCLPASGAICTVNRCDLTQRIPVFEWFLV
jgi:hypothetical protein